MADESLFVILDRIRFVLATPIDFTRTDSDSISRIVRLLTAAAVYVNVLSVVDFGGRRGSVREQGLVEQVVGAAFQTFGGIDPHPSPFEMAAMLLRGITQGHPFTDGSKRTGFLVAAFYLEKCGNALPAQFDEDAVVEFCLRVSAGELRDIDEMTRQLRTLWAERGRT